MEDKIKIIVYNLLKVCLKLFKSGSNIFHQSMAFQLVKSGANLNKLSVAKDRSF